MSAGTIDIFSYTQTQAAMDAIDKTRADGVKLYGGKFTTDELDATASGPLFKLPAGTFHGATMKVTKGVPAAPPAQPAPAAAPVVAQPQPVAVAPSLTLEALTVRSRVTLRSARRHGIHITAFAPQGASVLELKLLRGRRTVTTVLRRVPANRLLNVVLPSAGRTRRVLRRGSYTVAVTPVGGATTTRVVRVV